MPIRAARDRKILRPVRSESCGAAGACGGSAAAGAIPKTGVHPNGDAGTGNRTKAGQRTRCAGRQPGWDLSLLRRHRDARKKVLPQLQSAHDAPDG